MQMLINFRKNLIYLNIRTLKHYLFFRGVRTVKTEPATADSFTIYHNLNLSEMTGKSPMTLLGCTYETDREEMEKMLKE